MPNSDSSTATLMPAATIVPETERMDFLPRLFGKRHFFMGEMQLYDFMGRLSSDYRGGFWAFYDLAGEPLFLAPTSGARFRICWNGNGYEGEVSAEAAGIIATLFTLSNLSIARQDDGLAHAYFRLLDYASRHPEAAEILSAVD